MLCHLAGLTLDAVGASSFMWKQQHVVGHHAYTNVIGDDPDIRVSLDGGDVRRIVPQHPKGPQHAFQHVYLALLYALLAFKSIFIDDFNALSSGTIGAVQVMPFTMHEAATFWTAKLLFGAWFVAAPIAFSPWSWPQLLGLWAAALAICGWTLAFMFQVRSLLTSTPCAAACDACLCTQENARPFYTALGAAFVRAAQEWRGVQVAHVSDDVAFLEKDGAGLVPGSWAAQQIATCADFSHNSWVWTHVSGGLNYQAIHHLFPGVIHTHYPALAPIVLRAARKWGIPYKVYPTFWAALGGHFRHLRTVGVAAVIPSLQTIG